MGNVWGWRQSATTPSPYISHYIYPTHPRSEAGLTANLSNPARRLARRPRVRMQREKMGRMGTSDGRDIDVCKELSVYTLWNVVNKCIKNNESYDEHSSHNTLPINIIELEG